MVKNRPEMQNCSIYGSSACCHGKACTINKALFLGFKEETYGCFRKIVFSPKFQNLFLAKSEAKTGVKHPKPLSKYVVFFSFLSDKLASQCYFLPIDDICVFCFIGSFSSSTYIQLLYLELMLICMVLYTIDGHDSFFNDLLIGFSCM